MIQKAIFMDLRVGDSFWYMNLIDRVTQDKKD
jgi:hypothetical protein